MTPRECPFCQVEIAEGGGAEDKLDSELLLVVMANTQVATDAYRK